MDDNPVSSPQTPHKSRAPLVIGLLVLLIIIAVVVVLLVSHKNPSKSQGLTGTQTSAAKQQIEKNWQTFFAASTSLSDRESVLQEGSKFLEPIKSEFAALGNQSSSAVISNINLVNATTAHVSYTVNLNKQPVLTNQTGTALLINNKWQVSDATLCQLLGMAGSKPSVCQGVK